MSNKNNVLQFPGTKSPCTEGWSEGQDRNVLLTLNESELIALSLFLNDCLRHYEAIDRRPPEIILDLCDLQNKLADAWNTAK